MQTRHIPLYFQPEQAAQLRQAYTRLSSALETGSSFNAAELRDTLTAVLEAQPALGSGAFQHLREQRSVQHLLHLQIAGEETALLDLPWHLVAEGNPHLLVSKGLPGGGEMPAFKPDLPKPLKVLVMIAAPEDGGARLSYEAEEKIILDALAPLMRTGEVEVEFTDDGSLESLRRSLAGNRFHVLHFSGHGSFSAKKFGDAPEAILLLEDEFSMAARPTSAADFAAVLNADPDRMPALVFLSSCQTGMGGKDGGFRGAAQRLMQAGVPAVIAMGWSVADFWATHFARVFYEKTARRATLAEAFNQSLAEGRKVHREWLPESLSLASQEALHALFTAQSLIPQLFLTQQVLKLADWGAPSDKRLSRAGAALLEGKNRLGDKLKKIHAVFGRRDEWLFIGRRRERKAALAALRDGRSILLRGQGGMGKTALALHLAQRRLAADPDGCVPFAFDQTSLSLENICNALLDFLETDCRLRTMRTQAAAEENLWYRFFLLLENVEKQGVTPLFLLDNLETFQTEEGGPLKPEALELLEYFIKTLGYPVICTGRYRLREFGDDVLHPVDLNLVPFGDFRQKCLHLPALRRLDVPGRAFDETLRTLHRSLGGNYRSLEDFDELCRNRPAEAPDTLQTLDDLIARYAGEALQNRAKDLVFSKLLALLSPAEAAALVLLAQFNRPVLSFALEWQPRSPGEAEPICNRLADLTLAERRKGEAEGRSYYFVPPVVRELLKRAVEGEDLPGEDLTNLKDLSNLALDDERAGAYFEKAQEMNTMNPADHEEAFFHYERAKNVGKVNELGNRLSRFYLGATQFLLSFGIAQRTQALAGEKTDGGVINTLGLLFHHFGNLDMALHLHESLLLADRRNGDRRSEAVTLHNIGRNYKAKGDYDTALNYLQLGLTIMQEIGDRESEAKTLGNISQIHHARGNYDLALDCLRQGLKIQQEIGDHHGEGHTLNDISQNLMAKGEYDSALGYLRQCLTINQEFGDRLGEGAALNNIASIAHIKGDYNTALDYWQLVLKIQQEIGDRHGVGTTLNNISQIHQINGNTDMALSYLQQSLKIMQDIGDRAGEETTLNNIAAIAYDKGDYDTALDYWGQILKICREIGNRQGEGATLANIGQTYKAKGKYEVAMDLLLKGLKSQQEIGDRRGEGATLNNLGSIAQVTGNPEKALDYFRQSLKIRQEIGDRRGEGAVLNNLGDIYKSKGNHEKALGYWQQCLNIQKEIGDKKGEATVLNNISQIHDAKSDYNMATDYLKQSLIIMQEIGDRKGEGAVLNNLATTAHAKGDYETALDYFWQGLKIQEEIGDLIGMCPTLHNIASIYLHQKNEVEEFVKLEGAALGIAIEIGYAQGIYEIGRSFGMFLCQNDVAETGLPILDLALQAGQKAGLPGTEQVVASIQHFSSKM